MNATALVFAGVGPVLWIVCVGGRHARGQRGAQALVTTLKIGVLTIADVAVVDGRARAQGSYGLDVLKYTETVKAVARTSTPNEVLRGLGYWFFYGQDKLGPWTEAAINYTQHSARHPDRLRPRRPRVPLARRCIRWRHRAYFIGLLFIGVVIAVGAFPYDDPTPLGSLFKSFARQLDRGLALRSTGPDHTARRARASPCCSAPDVNATARSMHRRGRGYARVRRRRSLVVALAIAQLPRAVATARTTARTWSAPSNVPSYWTKAIAALDERSHSTRACSSCPAPTSRRTRGGTPSIRSRPGLMDRPYVAPRAHPVGRPGERGSPERGRPAVPGGRARPRRLCADLSRLMGVGRRRLRYDIQYERYDLCARSISAS